jgi:hypothetical protein
MFPAGRHTRYNTFREMGLFTIAAAISLTAATPTKPPLVLAQQKKQKKPAPKPEQPPPAPDDFDLLPKEATPDPAEQARLRALDEQLTTRRKMLEAHQLAGFVTLGALTATAVLGQLDYNDKYGGGGDTGKYHLWHRWMGFGTAAIFYGTASLAVFAPSPIPKPAQIDRTTLHKTFMTVAAAGMAAQIVLGIVTASAEGTPVQRNYAMAHQIIGYATVAAAYTGFAFFVF